MVYGDGGISGQSPHVASGGVEANSPEVPSRSLSTLPSALAGLATSG